MSLAAPVPTRSTRLPSTPLSRVGAWTSIAALALVIVGAPIHELAHAKWPGAGLSSAFSFDAVRNGRAAKELESRLERQAALTERIRPQYSEAMFRALGAVTPRVILGKDDWLFLSAHTREYPPAYGMAHLDETCATVAAVVRWFEAHGAAVELLVIPRKAAVHADKLPDSVRARYRPVYGRILASLTQAGLACVDLLKPLQASTERVYLPNDDHWDHPGALIAAREVAARVRERFKDRTLPGKPVRREIVSRPPGRFSGALVRMLGFAPDSPLLERFTVDRTPLVAADPRTPLAAELGSSTPQPVVLVGTSFSAGFFVASLLSAELGREVENRTREGHAGGYRMMDLAKELLLGQREFPAVLVWEFPEEFLVSQADALLDPLNALLEASAAPGPLVSSPLRIARRTEHGAHISAQSEALLEGYCSGVGAELVFELETPVVGDGSLRLSYELQVAGSGVHRVVFDGGADTPASDPKSFVVLRHELPNRVLLPIVAPDAALVRRVRVRILDAPTNFKLSPLELWRSADERLEVGR